MSDSLRPCESQHTRPPCPSPTPGWWTPWTHVHGVSDAIQPSHPLSSASPPAPNPSQHQGLTKLRRAETKRKKEFNLKAWEKETSNTVKFQTKVMQRQRNTVQMKEQTINTEVQINEEEIGKLPEKEFRIMRVKMIKNFENRMEKIQESINKDLEELKNKHTETNKTITETKNTLEGINSRISEAEEQISELEDKMVEITSEEQNKVKRMKRTEDSLRDPCDNIKCNNI